MLGFSTREAAKKLGLSASGLSKHIRLGKIPLPGRIKAGRSSIHVWNEEDIERVRQILPKIANGRKTRYKKKESAHGKPGSSTVSNQQSAIAKSKPKTKTQPTKQSKP